MSRQAVAPRPESGGSCWEMSIIDTIAYVQLRKVRPNPKDWRIDLDLTIEIDKAEEVGGESKAYIIPIQTAFKYLCSLNLEEKNTLHFM